MAVGVPFTYELSHSEVTPEEDMDSRGRKVTTVTCHGRLTAETKDQLGDIFKTTDFQGRIVFDLGDVDYMDSAGLGALLKLKVSAAKQGGVSIKYVYITPKVMQILKIANLAEWITS